MKKINILGFISLFAFLASSCNSLLEEHPRSILTPDFFKTTQGIESGLTAAYSGLRFQYGPEGGMSIAMVGTDEATFGGDGDARSLNDYGSALFNHGHITTPWNRNFTFINTCNGIIEFGPEAGKPELVAEAKFLRAQYYLNLVTIFGGVPLDLGSGDLKFNVTPSTESVRNSVIEVYEAIAQDFENAVQDLPTVQSIPGRVGKSAAIHYLAKTYLSMACYYQYDYANEGAANTGKAQEYYAKALQSAKMLLDNRGTYNVALLNDFADVNKAGNEHNREVLFLVEHHSDYTFDESGPANSGQAPNDGLKENRANFMMTPYYEAHAKLKNGNILLVRDRENGRGWRRFVPTAWLLNEAYADKINDTRYYKSYQSIWKCNQDKDGNTGAGKVKDNGQLSEIGDIAIYMPGYASYDACPSVIKTKIDQVIADGGAVWYPADYTRNMFPANLKHLDPAWPDGVGRDDSSHRPYIVAKLSETILIAAEAALMSGGDPALYINELRQRAAVGNENADEAAAKAAMLVSNGDISIDFILNERSREFSNEMHRWFDLVRTDNLVKRLQEGKNVFTSLEAGYSDNAARNVQRYHHLRPIPQSQIDLMTNANKADYQNPGYR